MTDREKRIHEVKKRMIEFYASDPKRTFHFFSVYNFSAVIGREEELSDYETYILLTAALVHDIGIKASEEKYNSSSGKYQELEGPPYAEKLLTDVGYDKKDIDRICFLVGNHHSYDKVDGIDFQILIEADFIVNAYEDHLKSEAIRALSKNIFKTKSGTKILDTLYLNQRS